MLKGVKFLVVKKIHAKKRKIEILYANIMKVSIQLYKLS